MVSSLGLAFEYSFLDRSRDSDRHNQGAYSRTLRHRAVAHRSIMFSIRRTFCSSTINNARRGAKVLPTQINILEEFRQDQARRSQVSDEILKNEEQRHNSKDTASNTYTNSSLSQYEPPAAKLGRTYSPADLSFEARRPLLQATRQAGTVDQFENYQINPLHEYKSYKLLSTFITDLGRIRTREQSGLSAKHQRQLGKAVRRARALSLLPTTAKHPDSKELRRPNSLNWIGRDPSY